MATYKDLSTIIKTTDASDNNYKDYASSTYYLTNSLLYYKEPSFQFAWLNRVTFISDGGNEFGNNGRTGKDWSYQGSPYRCGYSTGHVWIPIQRTLIKSIKFDFRFDVFTGYTTSANDMVWNRVWVKLVKIVNNTMQTSVALIHFAYAESGNALLAWGNYTGELEEPFEADYIKLESIGAGAYHFKNFQFSSGYEWHSVPTAGDESLSTINDDYINNGVEVTEAPASNFDSLEENTKLSKLAQGHSYETPVIVNNGNSMTIKDNGNGTCDLRFLLAGKSFLKIAGASKNAYLSILKDTENEVAKPSIIYKEDE